jgi:leader peptidase (prepilin peptidase)/N-methyltransferase
MTLLLWMLFIFGLLVGSFLNVMALRLLKEESFVHPPSHCPECKTPIAPYDNIPVLSYLLLMGKCRACKTGISVQYPLVELATGILFVWMGYSYGLSWLTPVMLFFMANLVVITLTDLKESLIFEINSLSLIPVGLIVAVLAPQVLATGTLPIAGFDVPAGWVSAAFGVLIPLVFFEGLIWLSQKVFGTEGFGHGDTHLMMGVGAMLGWERVVAALLLGFVLQAVLAIPLMVVQWLREKQYLSLLSGGTAFVTSVLPLGLGGLEAPFAGLLTLLCFIVTLAALFLFLRQVRQCQSYTYLPLGPALVAGTLIVLFLKPLHLP